MSDTPSSPSATLPIEVVPEKKNRFGWLNQQETVLVAAFGLIFCGVTALNPGFAAPSNLIDILYNSGYIAVAAVGMTMVILCGHIDISIDAALGLCATVAGQLAVHQVPMPIVVGCTILVGGAIGLINGCLISFGRIPAIVTTLGMASILKGGLLLVTGGKWIHGDLPPGFHLSRESILGMPVPILSLLIFGIIFSIWLKFFASGRELYAVGGNAEAARLSGISERGVTLRVFVLNGLLVGVAAVLYATNFTVIQANVAPGFALTVITSVVIGGVSILGGTGTIVGAMLGAVLLQTIGTALVFLHIRAEWFQTVQGSLILLTILLDVFRRRGSGTSVVVAAGGRDAASPTFFGIRWLSLQESILLGVLLIAVLTMSFTSDRFLTPANLINQTRFLCEVALLALPMTYVIILGGIDLSVGSMLALSAIVMGLSWQSFGLPLWLAVPVGILTGAIAGLLNGLVIVYLGVPPLIVTLATLAIYRGLSLGLSESRSFNGFPDAFGFWGGGDILGIPTQLYLLIAFFVLGGLLLARTPLGRSIYAIGNNETAARFTGLPVNRVKLFAYTLSGFMAGVAGFIFTSRVMSTRADAATGLELDVIAAVVFGGTSIFGGRGTILGTAIGVVTIQLLKDGLQLSGLHGEATIVLIGTVLILSILLNQFLESRVLAGRRFSK